MSKNTFSPHERSEVQKYFEAPLEELDQKTFEEKHRQLRAKFHPDNFEHLENEAVKEMATEKFQAIEALSEKIRLYLSGASPKTVLQKTDIQDFMHPDALFVGKRLKIEILTSDKDLKYHLFGTQYRWLEFGDSFKIPDTGASIHIDEGHRGHRVGFRESIRMYLTFGETDAVGDIVGWLFPRIDGRATTLLVVGDTVGISAEEIEMAIKKQTMLRIGAG